MYRHVRQSCKIANSDEGMEKLMDHTLARQNAELLARVDKLTAMVERMATSQHRPRLLRSKSRST
jgi:hypothetical protein